MKLNWHMILNVAVAMVLVYVAKEVYQKSRARSLATQTA